MSEIGIANSVKCMDLPLTVSVTVRTEMFALSAFTLYGVRRLNSESMRHAQRVTSLNEEIGYASAVMDVAKILILRHTETPNTRGGANPFPLFVMFVTVPIVLLAST